MKEVYCCDKMKTEGWYLEEKNGKITLREEYSAHFIENAEYCPWCGVNLKTVLANNR